MKINEIDIPKPDFIYGAVHLLANRLQTLGDKIDPTISTKQWFVLAAVSKFSDSPPNIGDIAMSLGTSRQNIKKIANILQKRGLLKLEKDKNDLRNILLFLTEQCQSYFKNREQQENEYLEKIFLGIDNEMLTNLCDGMYKLIENVDTILKSGSNAER